MESAEQRLKRLSEWTLAKKKHLEEWNSKAAEAMDRDAVISAQAQHGLIEELLEFLKSDYSPLTIFPKPGDESTDGY